VSAGATSSTSLTVASPSDASHWAEPCRRERHEQRGPLLQQLWVGNLRCRDFDNPRRHSYKRSIELYYQPVGHADRHGNLGGFPVANANTPFTIVEPNGTVVSGSSTTGANGTASFTMQLKRKAPTGTYSASVHATAGSLSGSGTTSFHVTR